MEANSQPVARRLSMTGSEEEGEGPVVDEEAIHQTMEMSQRLQLEALSTSISLSLSGHLLIFVFCCYGDLLV